MPTPPLAEATITAREVAMNSALPTPQPALKPMITTPIGSARELPGPVANLTGVRQVAAGDLHSLALTSDGSVWAFGNNGAGQLGNGTLASSYVPVQVPGLTGVTQIAAGGEFGLALRSDGTLWAWGRNGTGQLGNGTTNDSFVPVQVSGLSRVTQIAAGWDFAMAAATRGFVTTLTSVWTWGDNDFGQLGDGALASRSTPGQVSGIDVPLIRGISAGYESSMVLGSDGSVWGWGGDSEGQLGNAASKLLWVRPEETIGMDSGITQIAAGAFHVLALRSDGTVLAWGDNEAGEIGNGTRSETTPSLPMEVTGLTGVTQVAAGFDTSLAVHNIPFIILPSTPPPTQISQGSTRA
jgi:alpha-tubulin suppressor-like RCC1 family protein